MEKSSKEGNTSPKIQKPKEKEYKLNLIDTYDNN